MKASDHAISVEPIEVGRMRPTGPAPSQILPQVSSCGASRTVVAVPDNVGEVSMSMPA